MAKLNSETAPWEHLIGASAPAETGIVHLGLAQFHRAHAAIATAEALAAEPGPWGIVGVASHSREVATALKNQDHLYTVLQLTPEGESVGLVDVHRQTYVAADEPENVIKAIADPAHKIVTLTVSENGYRKDPSAMALDMSDEHTLSDLEPGAAPRTTIGLISRGLIRRHEQGGAPVTILSCDNMQSAGDLTKALVYEFISRAGEFENMEQWLDDNVTFPNAMVDRIVPGTTDETRQAVRQTVGIDDAVPVPAEEFTMWVMEDRFAAGRPSWEHAKGVIFSDEVEKYEQVKLRLLNGSHSLISYLGALDGRETIPAARTQPFVEQCVRRAIEDEFLPSIDLPNNFDVDQYIDQLFVRWTNFALGDLTARVGSDGSSKLVQRVPIPALRLMSKGTMPQQMALTVAAWIACVAPPVGFDPGPIARAMKEPARERLAEATSEISDPYEHVNAVFEADIFPDELARESAFVERVGDFFNLIVTDSIQAAAQEAITSALKPLARRIGEPHGK